MSRKQDPILPVLRFFEAASLESAQTGLAIARDIVRRRQAGGAKTTKTPAKPRVRVRKTTAAAVAPTVAEAPAVEAPRRHRKAATAKAETPPTPIAEAVTKKEIDLALPGLGPTTVGE